MYIAKLDDTTTNKIKQITNKYNNTYHRTINIKPVDLKSSIYIDFNEENNKRISKFKIGFNVRIWKYENIFAKGFVPNWFENVFVIKKVKDTLL